MSLCRHAYACRHALPAAPPPACITHKTTATSTLSANTARTRTRTRPNIRTRQTTPSSSSPFNHVWISDDLLARLFRQFKLNHAQRRYGSQVPGPLEARRRLARRRNTAFAAAAGNFDPAVLAQQQLDMAALFGRNGREHMMKWGGGGVGDGGMCVSGSVQGYVGW